MSANTAIHNVAIPARANAKNTTLIPRAKAMFCAKMVEVLRLSKM